MKPKETKGEWKHNDSDGKLIQAMDKKPDTAKPATHLWGFEEVDGARRHTQRPKVTRRDDKEINVRMVSDFDGE